MIKVKGCFFVFKRVKGSGYRVVVSFRGGYVVRFVFRLRFLIDLEVGVRVFFVGMCKLKFFYRL